MKNILITGGTGYIGQYLIKTLRDEEYNIFITSRKSDKKIGGLDNRILNLEDEKTIEGVCKDIDIVVHTANLDERLIKEKPREALLINSYASRQLYLDADKNNVKNFIYLSTFHVYGADYGYIDEQSLPNPRNDYALTHYIAELYLKQLSGTHLSKVSVLRLANGIGAPLDGVDKWYLVINDFCRMALENHCISMKSNGLPIRDFIAIKDVCAAIKLLIKKTSKEESFEIYNISSEKTYSIRDIAYKVKEISQNRYGKTVSVDIPEVTDEEIRAVKPLNISSDKIRSLGWCPKWSLEEIVNEIFDVLEKGGL